MLTGTGGAGGGNSSKYSLYVISETGRVLRSATATVPSIGSHMPRFSVAGRSVYFIDGDRSVKVLRADGSVAPVIELPGGRSDRVVFAVSPDEQQIAFSVLHYTTPACASGQPCYPTTSTSLRVGRLDGTAIHEIFASSSVVEFPIGWIGNQLLISVTRAGFIQNPGEVNPYFAYEYHVADSATAARTFDTGTVCDADSSALDGPVIAAGTICRQRNRLLVIKWNGRTGEISVPATGGSVNPPVILNPDGQRAAASFAPGYRITLLDGSPMATSAAGTPAGWFDPTHLLFMTGPSGAGGGGMLEAASVLDIVRNVVTPITGLAGTADPYAPFFVSIPNDLG